MISRALDCKVLGYDGFDLEFLYGENFGLEKVWIRIVWFGRV
jgi:hypothetical protein